jgi:hypothetical protein
MNDKDIESFNNKGEAHGYWEWYHFFGGLWYKGLYHNGKEIGYEEYYENYIGELTRKTYYL